MAPWLDHELSSDAHPSSKCNVPLISLSFCMVNHGNSSILPPSAISMTPLLKHLLASSVLLAMALTTEAMSYSDAVRASRGISVNLLPGQALISTSPQPQVSGCILTPAEDDRDRPCLSDPYSVTIPWYQHGQCDYVMASGRSYVCGRPTFLTI